MTDDARAGRARKLGHDLRSNLSIISVGLEALAGLRNDESQFEEIRAMIQDQGVAPMMEMIDRLVGLASEED